MFDIWPYKLKEVFVSTGKVALWVFAMGGLAAVYAHTQEVELNTTNTLIAQVMGLLNIGLYGLIKYLTLVDPSRAAKKAGIANDQVAS